MKEIIIAIVLLSILSTITHTQENPDPPEGWVLHWNDEFDGTEVDRTKWSFEIGNGPADLPGWGNKELQYYTDEPSNVFIQDGKLVIQANKEEKEGFQYTSTRMKTQGKFNATYGIFEVYAKLPPGQPGLWPSFWLLGENIDEVGWPACGEIDIFEFIGRDPKNIHGSTHGEGFDTTSQHTYELGFSDSFHKYSINWQPDIIEFFFDDELYETVTPEDINGAAFLFNDNPMFILLNFAVGGEWPGNPDETTEFPSQYIVDWVRVYEKIWPPESGQAVNPAMQPLKASKPNRRICRKPRRRLI